MGRGTDKGAMNGRRRRGSIVSVAAFEILGRNCAVTVREVLIRNMHTRYLLIANSLGCSGDIIEKVIKVIIEHFVRGASSESGSWARGPL